MIYSAGCEYAIRAIAELARHWPEKQYVLLRAVARETGLAGPYLGKLMQRLVLAGIVQSLKGRTGGYRLARDPKKVHLIDIVKTIDGTEQLSRSIAGLGPWREREACPHHRAWAKLHAQLLRMLETTTAGDLAQASQCKRCRPSGRK
jgi:Rrf2 family iron-sulfur cluster assembly transcriptional regulator